ncbi:hypothetical protein GCM10007879_02430 [Maritalea porphyrae]|uniref:Tash protein PEST motif family n=1 Tax=Maritalea porphyrae TaxID=880732 RepID=A0ABQ5ULB0_9HYPH|nr:hypothetical protein GCM10007879_02430 [Maritalea porphyrae]
MLPLFVAVTPPEPINWMPNAAFPVVLIVPLFTAVDPSPVDNIAVAEVLVVLIMPLPALVISALTPVELTPLLADPVVSIVPEFVI